MNQPTISLRLLFVLTAWIAVVLAFVRFLPASVPEQLMIAVVLTILGVTFTRRITAVRDRRRVQMASQLIKIDGPFESLPMLMESILSGFFAELWDLGRATGAALFASFVMGTVTVAFRTSNPSAPPLMRALPFVGWISIWIAWLLLYLRLHFLAIEDCGQAERSRLPERQFDSMSRFRRS